MPSAVVFIADGYEEIEAVTVIDILRRAEIETAVVSITGAAEATGSHGLTLVCDSEFLDAADVIGNADALVLPGGPGTKNLKNHAGLAEAFKRANETGRLLCAICAAPSVLGGLGLLRGKSAVCYPGCENELEGASVSDAPVVVDGNVITAKAAGSAHDFAFKIVEALFAGSEKNPAAEVRARMYY